MLLGLTGVAQSGKSTVAEYLKDNYGFKIYNFSDGVKDALYAMNPMVAVEADKPWDRGPYYVPIQTLVDDYGWDEAKQIKMVRELLQRMGTEAGRNIHGWGVWVNRTFNQMFKDCGWDWKFENDRLTKHCTDDIVIPDLRFDNEAERIKHHGGVIVKVDRGNKPVNGHSSESGIDAKLIDVTFYNTGSYEELQEGIDRLLGYIGYENIRRSRD